MAEKPSTQGPKKKKARKNWHKANLSGLDGWHEAHAVMVRTGESYVSQCWWQKIAAMSRRGRFINATLG